MADENAPPTTKRDTVPTSESVSSPASNITDTLKKSIDAEKTKQSQVKASLSQLESTIRELRKNQRELTVKRAELTKEIRDLQTEIKEDQDIVKDKDVGDSRKSEAKERIQQSQVAIYGKRRDQSVMAQESAKIGLDISKGVGAREQAENYQRDSKASARDAQLELNQRDNQREQAEKLTPQTMMRQMKAQIPADSRFEGEKAAAQVAAKGGTKTEQADVRTATTEFHELAVAIKDTRKKLADLQEGTDEFAQKQNELSGMEAEAAKKIGGIDKIQKAIEMRGMGGQSTGEKITSGIAGAAAGVARFGEAAFGQLGDRATSRYVLEEERKQAQLQIRAQSLSDVRNRTTDATAFLATGAGKRFGAETPYDEKGEASQPIKKLSEDFANTREAVVQQQFLMRSAAGAANLAGNVVGSGIKGAAVGPQGAIAGAAGEAIMGGGKFALDTVTDAAFTPEVMGRFGGQKATSAVRGMIEGTTGAVTKGAQSIGTLVGEGGGNEAGFRSGMGKVGAGVNSVMTALPNTMQRAYESVEQQNQMVTAQQESAQISRVRERLSTAFAPQMQRFMDVQPTMGAAMRGRQMSRAEREQAEKGIEGASMDTELSERGFVPEQIIQQNANTSQRLGRFGAGGMNERVAKSGMMGEAMGLGDAGSNVQAMGRMVQGGVKDPEALFTKAMAEGLKKGIQDSRQFQELLNAASETATSTAGYEGALNNLLKMTGGGQAGDVKTAQAAYKGVQQDMSGFSGDWTDVVKFDITNKAAQKAATAAKKQGTTLSREDMTSLQNLANLKPEEIANPELLKRVLTPNALKATEALGGNYGEDLNRSMMVHGQMDRAINATQSPELVQLRNMLSNNDQEGLKKTFAGPEGQAKLKRLMPMVASGMTSTGDTDRAIGSQNAIAQQISEATGISPEQMGLPTRGYKPKTLDEAKADSGASGTFADQQRKAEGEKGRADFGAIQSVERDPKTGKNLLAEDVGKTGGMYRQGLEKTRQDVLDNKTVNPALEVKRVDQAVDEMVKGLKEIADSFKDFSAKDMVVNATKDIIISGAAAIKGVMLDNGLSAAAKSAGDQIANTVSKAFGGSGGGSSTPPPATKAAPSKSVPEPQGG